MSTPNADDPSSITLDINPRRRRRGRLIALTIFGLLAFNYPLLSLFADPVLWFGIPKLYLYLFSTWSLFILLLALIVSYKPATAARAELSPSATDEEDD